MKTGDTENRKVLIIDRMHESIVPMLQAAGFEPDYQPDITLAEVRHILPAYAVLLLRSKLVVDAELLAHADQLRVIGRAGAGLDQIDRAGVLERNIQLVHAPEGNRDAVAEHTLGMLLALLNKLAKADREVRQGIWDREANRGYELAGKTVGLIGFGYMGQAVAQRLQGFNCRILVYDKYRRGLHHPFVQEVSLEELQAEADIVSLHIPLTEENRGLVNNVYIDRFQKPIFLLNTARGEILSLQAAVAGLKSGKLRGLALDVLENEKINKLSSNQKESFDYLVSSDKVLLSPHVAGWTYESYQKINRVLVDKLVRIMG